MASMGKSPIERSGETGNRKERSTPPATQGGTELHDLPYEEVAMLAYSYWEARGGGDGSAEEDWYRAEDELRQRRTQPQTRSAGR